MNQWSHVAWTIDGVHWILYVNAVPEVINETTLPTHANVPLSIGNAPTHDRPFQGAIDEVRVYNRALTAEEIKQIFLSGALKHGLLEKIDAKLRVNRGTATIASGTTSVTFAHGLSGTPTLVTLGATHAEVADAIWSADATNITITVPAAVTANRNISWYAERKP
jgi:hypothetical protein